MDDGYYFFIVLILCLNNQISESFRWTRNQQSSQIINTLAGSDVTFPCEFLLTPEEESAMQHFHLIYWTREMPRGSDSWQGLITKTNLISNSQPKAMFHDKSRILMTNNSMTILSVTPEDDTQYQCEIKSSFYTTPSVIKLNVLERKLSRQTSTLSNAASAGIGVGVTILIFGLIIVGAKSCKNNSKRRTATERSTSLSYIPSSTNNRTVSSPAYVGPAGYYGSDVNISGVVPNNEYHPEVLDFPKPLTDSAL